MTDEAKRQQPLSIARNGRLYTRLAVADDGSSLYQSEQRRGRDF